MVKRILLWGLICSSLLPASAQLSRLRVVGNQFLNATNEPVILRGLNASDPDKLAKEGHWEAGYFAEMKAWGANAVRFPVHPRAWRERGKKEYLSLLDQGIEWATEQGLYVIIDWHSIGNLPRQQFQHEMYTTTQKETFAFWKTIAHRYGDHPTVAFYELYNEPSTNKGNWGACSWEEWKWLMESLIGQIRKHGGTGIPLVAGFNWAYDLTPIREQPIEAEGIGYISHPYPQKRPAPWAGQWTHDWGYVHGRFPLVLTEIGFAGEEEKGAHIPVISDESYGEAILNYCEARGISYCLWVFDPQWAPGLFSDWDYTPTRQGRFFKERWKNNRP